MNFTVAQDELYESLHKVVGVVPQKTTISILTCILLELKGDQLSLTGTDLEISATLSLSVKGSEDGTSAIPARLFLEIVRELPNIPLNIATDEGDKIIIKTEKGEYKISSQLKEDFPKIQIEESAAVYKLAGVQLQRMINNTIFAVSTDELRPALTGIYIEITPTEIRFVGTDGHRLSRYIYRDFKADETSGGNMIVPTKALNLLLRNLDEEEEIDIQVGEDHIVFNMKDALIYSKLISGTYPNYERVIPVGNDKRLQVNRDLFISTLRRVSIFSSSLTHQVRLVLMPQEMTIYSEDIEFGAEAKESIPVSFSDEWLQLGYNSNYLLDILRHIDSEEVLVSLKDSSSAAIIQPAEQKEQEEITLLLMPIRITEESQETEEEQEEE
jgi:DNA polymerase-3 subunit beta